jgi:hypothetical protein
MGEVVFEIQLSGRPRVPRQEHLFLVKDQFFQPRVRYHVYYQYTIL